MLIVHLEQMFLYFVRKGNCVCISGAADFWGHEIILEYNSWGDAEFVFLQYYYSNFEL